MNVIGKIRTHPQKKSGSGDNGPWELMTFDIDRNLYSTFNKDFMDFKMGDDVEIEYEKKGKYNTIKTMKLAGKGGDLEQFKQDAGPQVPLVDTQRLIVRQSALNQANVYFANILKLVELGILPKESAPKGNQVDVLAWAKEFESWVFRD